MSEVDWKFEKQAKGRCINIDWLEVYCKEDNSQFPQNADWWRAHGFFVREREYGTRQYHEMFIILDENDQPFIEIRRNPVSSSSQAGEQGIFDPLSCHIRLSNRYCYHPDAINLFSNFLLSHYYTIQHIFRLDLCLDFEKFDRGDDPHDFLMRYLRGKFTKINQGNLSAHGKDRWEGRDFNSVSWGAPSSMVTTKMYCKTLELLEAKDKPYIRYAWMAAGLVDDYQHLTKTRADGTIYTPTIWRVEFSIRSSARHWLIVEDCNGHKSKRIAKNHDLGCYATKLQQLEAFAMLAHHYFHFKHYQKDQRKDRCPDKVLFDFGLNHKPYVLDRLLADAPKNTAEQSLLKKLQQFRIVHPEKELIQACDVLIKELEQLAIRHTLPNYYDRTEAQLLQLLINRRLSMHDSETFQQSIQAIQGMLDVQEALF